MKILLIDDDVFLRDMYSVKFIELGHTVEVSGSAQDALKYLSDGKKYDVILIDMVMPGMSGLQFLQTVTEKNIANGAVCIVLSNQGQNADVEEAIDAGAHAYIIKAEYIPSEVVRKTEDIFNETKV